MAADPSGDREFVARVVRTANGMVASYHTYVCWSAIDSERGTPLFDYEFLGGGMTEESAARAVDQLNYARGVQHPSVLRILAVVPPSASTCLRVITEGARAPSLQQYLQQLEAPLTSAAALRWFRLICQGLQSIHQARMPHGCLSPRLIYVVNSKAVKLRLPLSRLSGCETVVLIDQYISPERLRASSSTCPDDVWALGILLLEMAYGVQAYQEYQTPRALVGALVGGALPQLLDAADAEVARVARLCLLPASRRPSVDELLADPGLGAVAPPAVSSNGDFSIPGADGTLDAHGP